MSKSIESQLAELQTVLTQQMQEQTESIKATITSNDDARNAAQSASIAEIMALVESTRRSLGELATTVAAIGANVVKPTGTARRASPKASPAGPDGPAAAKPVAKFPSNTLNWFKQEMFSNEQFRASIFKFLDEHNKGEVSTQERLSALPEVLSKKTDDARVKQVYALAWRELADNHKEFREGLTTRYNALKKDHAFNDKPAQLEADDGQAEA